MTVYPDKDLQSALNTALAAAFPTMPIAWENVPYDPAVGTPYLRATLLPAETDLLTLGQQPFQERKGVFQVDCFYPTGKGQSWAPAKSKAAEVVAYFYPSRTFTYNTVSVQVDKSWPGVGAIDSAGWYHVPVNIRYLCYSNA